jgi:phosphate transport system ATP-binding protein
MDKIPEMTQLSPSWTREDSEDTGPLEDGLVHKTESTPFVSALTDPVLKTINLSVGFGKADILHGVSVEIARGETTALIGPTGSGKSTFLRALNRMNDRVTGYRHDGDVLLDGESIFRPSLDMLNLRRKVGMLFQRPNPFPMSIRDNVVAGVKAHRMAKRSQFTTIAEERLTQVGLFDAVKDRMNRSPFELSGGQQQLLCLARALAVEPEVLLLDEPTSSLDPVTTERVESLIKNLTPHISVIIVTHNLGQARRVSDRTMLFFDGRLAEFATTEQLFEHPVNETTANYVSGRIG